MSEPTLDQEIQALLISMGRLIQEVKRSNEELRKNNEVLLAAVKLGEATLIKINPGTDEERVYKRAAVDVLGRTIAHAMSVQP